VESASSSLLVNCFVCFSDNSSLDCGRLKGQLSPGLTDSLLLLSVLSSLSKGVSYTKGFLSEPEESTIGELGQKGDKPPLQGLEIVQAANDVTEDSSFVREVLFNDTSRYFLPAATEVACFTLVHELSS